MAKKDLIKVLEQTLENLKKDSAEYRRLISNKKAHYINFKESDIRRQVNRSLLQVGGYRNIRAIPEDMKRIVSEGVAEMFDKLVKGVRTTKFNKYQITEATPIKGSKGYRTFSFVFSTADGYEDAKGPFDAFKGIKQGAQADLIINLNNQLKKEGRLMDEVVKGKNTGQMIQAEFGKNNFLDVGHVGESAIARQRNAMVQNTLLEISSSASSPALTNFLKQLEGSVALVINKKQVAKTSGGGKEVVEVKLESTGDNRAEDLSLYEDLNKDLEAAIAKLGKTKAGLLGLTAASKDYAENIEDAILHNFSKMKGKKNFKQEKPKRRKKPKISIPAAELKGRKGRGFKDTKAAPPLKMGEEGKQSPINLMSLINAKLPQTVRKNMGAPRLENQTGAFAASVRVTDASRTPQGFPSIGYTYQRQPYGVFEASSGSRFASPERDPRTLIDISIREIAAQLVTGRLYTRRV